MISGIGWTLVNVNSLPMVMDSTGDLRVGAYIGLFFLFSTLGAIVGPVINGLIIQWGGGDYSLTMLAGPFFMLAAFVLMLGVHRGEAINPLRP
jgi:MFS family permease